MTGRPRDNRNALDRLTEELIEDILATPDEEILSEARQDHDDPAKVTMAMQALFEKAATNVAKQRFAAAKAAVAADRQQTLSSSPMRRDPVAARRRLQSIVASDPETARKLTLAARKGEGLSDEDVFGMLEDLEYLGVLGPDPSQDRT